MNRAEYAAAVAELNKKPPMKETPKGQKFNIGDRVITIEGFWGDEPDSTSPGYGKGRIGGIEYSYYQKFGDHSRTPNPNEESLNKYSVDFGEGGEAWWDASKLKLI